MRQHQEGELLTGLWHFPLVEREIVLEAASKAEILEPFGEEYLSSDYIAEEEFNYNDKLNLKEPVKHVFSHRIWQVHLIPIKINDHHTALIENLLKNSAAENWRWLRKEDLVETPLSTLQRKLLNQVGLDD